MQFSEERLRDDTADDELVAIWAHQAWQQAAWPPSGATPGGAAPGRSATIDENAPVQALACCFLPSQVRMHSAAGVVSHQHAAWAAAVVHLCADMYQATMHSRLTLTKQLACRSTVMAMATWSHWPLQWLPRLPRHDLLECNPSGDMKRDLRAGLVPLLECPYAWLAALLCAAGM